MRPWFFAVAIAVLAASSDAAAAPEKRPLPDYDGRGPKPTTVGDVLLWGPRVVALPLYLTSEFVVRRPLGWVVTTAEKNHWPTQILAFFTFDRDRKSGVVPTALYDFGLRPSIGAYFFADDFFASGNALRVHAATWGPQWLSFTVADRIPIVRDRSTFTLRAEFTQRPDGVFAGMGPRTREADVGRFATRRVSFGPAIDVLLFRASTFRAELGARRLAFRADQGCCDEPSVADQLAAGAFALPPGFEQGYTALFQRVELALDTRKPPPSSLTGVRLAFEAEHGADVSNRRGTQWLRYGAQLGGFVDLDGKARVLGLVLSATLADRLSGDEVPFTEQVNLGGFGPMRGYRPGRLVDRSALVATLQYQWPIWVWLDGALHVAVGNVWGPRFQGFDPKLLRLSSGIGFRTVGSPDHQFEFLVAGATETLDQGLQVTAFRLLLGATRGF